MKTGKACGIDLGLKTIATLSNGKELSRENLTKKYEEKLAIAQRAGKKKQPGRRAAATIHAKIKNRRKDWNHKKTTELVRDYDYIAVGNVSSSKLKKTAPRWPEWLNQYPMLPRPRWIGVTGPPGGSKPCLPIKLLSLAWR